MAWIAAAVLIVLLVMSPVIGLLVQPWAPWWMQQHGNTPAAQVQVGPIGTVPPPNAIVAPEGPSLGEQSPLLQALRPWMGVRYLFGGNTTAGVDCSGLIVQVLRQLGISMPWRTAQTQFDHTARIVSPAFGDLVFFRNTYVSSDTITHVGFYVGDGWMISAAEPAVGRQQLSNPYWVSHLAGYGRY